MDQLVAMRAFVEIVDRGSLTAAATALDRSLPTMVRTLSALEAHLGARLLQRTTRRMSLTDEGRDYLERARHILADVEDAERAVGRGQGEPRGALRVSAPVLFGQMHVAPVMTAFVRRYPRVRVELQLLDRLVDLVDEGIDLAVRIGHLSDSSMVAVRVGQMRRVVCASPDLLRADDEPQHPAELASRPCVRFRGITSGDTWRFRAGGHDLPVRVGGSFSCNQAATAAEACAEGLGFGLLLAYQVEPLVRAGRLRIVLEAFEPPPLPVSLVYPHARLMSSRLRALVAWLKDGLGNGQFDVGREP
jgi:DNA-binding transcriptional LysR family regulator